MTATISRPKISNWETSNIPNLTGKTALITGANSGLGYYTAKALAEKNAQVIIACRSLEKANQTIKKLKAQKYTFFSCSPRNCKNKSLYCSKT